MEGIILKGIGGFYYVKTEERVYECKARGKFRNKKLTPMVGDRVIITPNDNNYGAIEEICTRDNYLIRPQVANISQAFIVFALKNPDVNLDLLNKFLIQCELKNIKSIVCFNKIDLYGDYENHEAVKMVSDAGYDYIFLKAKEETNLDELKSKLKGNINVFCGPSGVGKSTILNKLVGKEVMETGIISERLKRGKHTTRHSELVEVNNGFVVDTPGFSTLDLKFDSKEELKDYFREFYEYKDQCKFNGCLHHKEPKCGVKDAVNNEEINKDRYEFYVKTLEEIIQGGRNKW
ncbi:MULTISPECIES: ribosome small subunit-dependent GTPase A [Clostridium]|uniref:Small ribosomal subunit biogenesis GTPase RsgA n=1 Tax=Clostridium novyi (strain NT) TaxID=386415 RepID=RSGA_CLONN|nr:MULTISPECIES: ribosome small subunit-dependent GTPase A [Clostridium]A0Q109.1 RecName: Full=Small ribosomal subunit biogenesis GTPase RsgA [Clostridium novyi NT]ABK61828.1 ribosome-associated GTPase YjeQ [Clostridium novyi NT]KEH85102.1 ribosome biogenesis GTPase RsgA [Clostridium novyi A str. NCTC 538]KEH85846.1 ribosome biogenesis GTPase RsgA [Clostridium novyi A str. 4540]KEH85890.1 ribosome biogenesis GTPase RsgA [Clostridium novyi A str. BKT29909]KEH91906.1 ribosome biogenesis GTPase 